jgi:hypothetical protein
MRWARIPHSVEAFGLFADVIPQLGWDQLNSHRKKQGAVPDFHVRGGVQMLAELKVIGCCSSHYPAAAGAVYNTPVEKRASKIPAEIEDNLRKIDSPDGAVVARLHSLGRVRGLVVGAFGECSPDLLHLMDRMAKARLGGSLNGPGGSGAVTYVRKRVGVAAVRAQADLILAGVQFCGPGGGTAYARRHDAKQRYLESNAAVRADFNVRYERTHASVDGAAESRTFRFNQ